MNPDILKVLLIEDNPGDAFLIKFYLEESTAPVFQVSHSDTVKDGLELLDNGKFDIILSDMNLPDSFGVDTVKSILGKHPGNLVIVLTGLTDEEVGLETVRYGAQDFLTKGKFDGKVLISSVMFAFERFKLNTQIAQVSQQLNEEESRLDSIQHLLNVGYFEVDPDTMQVCFCNAYTMEIFGAVEKPSDLWKGVALSADAEAMKEKVREVVAGKSSGEFTFRTVSGQELTARFGFRNGKVCGVLQPVNESAKVAM